MTDQSPPTPTRTPTPQRLGELTERRMRGELNAQEQRELEIGLSAHPEVARTLAKFEEDLNMLDRSIDSQAEGFDPNQAVRALRARRRGVAISTIGGAICATGVGIGYAMWNPSGGSMLIAALYPVLYLSIGAVVMLALLHRWARRAEHAAELDAEGLDQLAGDLRSDAEKDVRIYQISAVVLVVFLGSLTIDALASGASVAWFNAVLLAISLPNVYFAFNRGNIDRLRRGLRGERD
ncbi:MAG: hypothetical protein AAF356_02645 [Planctomycetota bacterium]